MGAILGDRPNTVSESTVSNTKLSEFFCAHRVPGTELSELLSDYYFFVCQSELTECAAELSEFSLPKQYSRNSIPPPSVSGVLFPMPLECAPIDLH